MNKRFFALETGERF